MTERDANWHYDQMMAAIKANAWPPSREAYAGWLHNRHAEGYRAGYADGTRPVIAEEVRLLMAKAEALEAEVEWFENAYNNALDKGFTKQYLDGFKSAVGWLQLHAGFANDAVSAASGGGGVEAVTPPD